MDDMNITSAQYYNDLDGNKCGVKATIDGVELLIPIDTGNRHYQAIQEWASQEGNTIQDAD